MADVLLTIYCAPVDVEAVAAVLRTRTAAAVHLRDEAVRGRDYQDANMAEQVSGLLRRVALSLVVDAATLDELVHAAGTARRERPLRWHVVPVLERGRIE